jgi:predicted metalloprotease with PDZ domain
MKHVLVQVSKNRWLVAEQMTAQWSARYRFVTAPLPYGTAQKVFDDLTILGYEKMPENSKALILR